MTLLLIDATNVVMRCASVSGVESATAVDTAVGIVQRAVRTVGATHAVAAFDSSESVRRATYPAYKANRTTETAAWVALGLAAFQAAGICCASAHGFEADDVIATLAGRTARVPIAVLSGDSDLLVLTSDRVAVWQFDKAARGGIVQRPAAWICEKYGIPSPAHLTLYKALVGEPGDNVPGVPKVGPVKARKLIAEFGDLDTMTRLGVLNEHAEWAAKAVTLLTLYDFAPVPAIAREAADVRRMIERRAA